MPDTTFAGCMGGWIMGFFNIAIREFTRFIEHLTMQQWLYVLVVGVIVGFFCLRGFGSRSDY